MISFTPLTSSPPTSGVVVVFVDLREVDPMSAHMDQASKWYYCRKPQLTWVSRIIGGSSVEEEPPSARNVLVKGYYGVIPRYTGVRQFLRNF